jgi:transposase-like protein
MEFVIELHLGGLSLSKTVLALERFGVSRARSTIHNWVQKADLEPRGGCSPDKVALDETVVKIDGEQFWLVGAVDPATNRILHVGIYASRNTAMIEFFLDELNQKHDVQDAVFLVDGAPWLHPPSIGLTCNRDTKRSANATRSNGFSSRLNAGRVRSTTTSATRIPRPSKTGCSRLLGPRII